MARALKFVAVVAGVVALAATGLGLAMGAFAFAGAFGTSAATIAAVASAVAAVAGTAAQALMKPPDMKGSINQIVIGKNLPVPYCMGRSYSGGEEIYDDSAGDKNKWRTKIVVDSVGGPIEEYQAFLTDYQSSGMVPTAGNFASNSTGWYNDFLFCGTRKGLRPETALTAYAGHPALRNWTAAHKLSGIAAAAMTMKFDKDGKRFSGGIPQMGRVAKWVWAYDPRLDSTYPGGVGAQRWEDEATWTWSENPALHALAYARGRFITKDAAGVNLPAPRKVVGAGIPRESINVARFVELANLCVANGWTIGGTVYEAPGISRWDNLLRILAVAAARPVWIGGALDIKFSSPKVALDTITADDIVGDLEITAMSSWKERWNSIVPRMRSEAHKWEYVQIDAVTSSTYLAEDGEAKTTEQQWDLCQDKDQAAELTAYLLANAREFPVTLTVKPRLGSYRPGEALAINVPGEGLVNQLFTINSREVNPATGEVTFTLESETTAKHAFALGRTAVAPPTPSLWSTQTIDEMAGINYGATRNVWRGAWAAGVQYLIGDLVSIASGIVYEALLDHLSVAGVPPPNANWLEWVVGNQAFKPANIAGGTIVTPGVSASTDINIPATGGEVTVMTSSSVPVGDSVYGTALVEMQGNWDGTVGSDAFCEVFLDLSINGGAYVRYAQMKIGAKSTSGAVKAIVPFKMAYIVGGFGGSAVQTIQARMMAISIVYAGSARASSDILQPQIIIQGGQR